MSLLSKETTIKCKEKQLWSKFTDNHIESDSKIKNQNR